MKKCFYDVRCFSIYFRNPDPARYHADSTEAVFTRFYNSIAGDTLNFDEIRMQYLMICGNDLDIVVPDTCSRMSQLITDFEQQFGSYQWPRALARDLFTSMYNLRFKPVKPYYWKDMLRVFADDSCDLSLPVFPADSAYYERIENEFLFSFYVLKAYDRDGVRYYRRDTPHEGGILLDALQRGYHVYVDACISIFHDWTLDDLTDEEIKLL